MDEEVTIIDTQTRNEKIKNFFVENRRLLISFLVLIILGILSFYSFQIYINKNKENLSEKYNSAILEYENGNKSNVVLKLKQVVEDKDSTYSPLALYFLIDNELIEDQDEINQMFNILINKTSLETEIKNLIIYKKALYNSNNTTEIELLEILKPILNSKSVWKSHALYLIAEYFYSKDEKQKSKEFFNQIISTENANPDILNEAQKRLTRDLSD